MSIVVACGRMLPISRTFAYRFFTAIALVSGAIGCALFSGSSSEVRTIRSAGTEAREAHSATLQKMIDRLALRVRARRDARLDILLLSGGGQHGAYTAGFLRGWAERNYAAMPKFDLVTGVSSGALQAPFALLGTPAAVARAASLFRDEAVELAPTAEFWPALQRSGGLPDASRYRALVERAIDASIQTELRAEFDAERQIAIATTDFDLGALRIWDFGHELGVTPKGRRRAQALLLASATVPGVFPPILIDNHVHAAGDVFGSLLIPMSFDNYRFLVSRLRARGVSETITVYVYVLFNGYVEALSDRVDPDDRKAMASRSTELLFLATQAQALDHLSDLTDAVNGGVRGLRMELRISMIPRELAEVPGADEAFSETYTMQLEQTAYERARGDALWDRVVEPRTRAEY